MIPQTNRHIDKETGQKLYVPEDIKIFKNFPINFIQTEMLN